MLRDILYESGERILGMYHRSLLFNFDFGMRHSIGFLLMLFTANVLLVAIYLLVSTFVNQEESLWHRSEQKRCRNDRNESLQKGALRM